VLPIHTILHPTGLSEESEAAFGLACSLARDHGARLVVLCVVPLPVILYGPPPEEYLDHLWEQLAQTQARDPQVRIEHLLVEGDPATEILRTAAEVPCDLIVMGTHGRTGLTRLILGSVAEQVLRQAPCPVLTVKAPPRAAEPVRTSPATTIVTEAVPAGEL
jgi:nucleotide-binding universal stress UspA family protein